MLMFIDILIISLRFDISIISLNRIEAEPFFQDSTYLQLVRETSYKKKVKPAHWDLYSRPPVCDLYVWVSAM